MGGALTFGLRSRIAALALEYQLPMMHLTAEFARAGMRASYGPSLRWRDSSESSPRRGCCCR